MNSILASGILFYQRHLSPHKGFKCAYGVATKECTCSSFGLKVAKRYPLFKALGLIKAQLNRCHHASVLLKERYPPLNPRTVPRSQQGIIDACDCPADACSSCSCPDTSCPSPSCPEAACPDISVSRCSPSGLDAAECVCDTCDPGDCFDFFSSKKSRHRRSVRQNTTSNSSAAEESASDTAQTSDLKVNLPSAVLVRKFDTLHPLPPPVEPTEPNS